MLVVASLVRMYLSRKCLLQCAHGRRRQKMTERAAWARGAAWAGAPVGMLDVEDIAVGEIVAAADKEATVEYIDVGTEAAD